MRGWWPVLAVAAFLAVFCGGNAVRLEKGLGLLEANSRVLDASGHDVPPAWRGHKLFGDPDAYCWMLYAADLLENGRWRIRHSSWDNVPDGRDVHWCQLPVWGIAALAKGWQRAAGLPLPAAVERAAAALMPLAGIVFLFAAFLAVRRRWGAGAAWLFLAGTATFNAVFFTFHPTRPDHHGFQLAFLVSAWLLLLAGNLGWRDAAPEAEAEEGAARRRRSAFLAAGVCTGCLFWLSATVAMFAAAGICLALGATLVRPDRRQLERLRWDGGCWAAWGRSAAATSLFLYFVEYAPRHFSMHLEPNHPLYALFLLGLGECIPLLGGWWTGTEKADRRWWANLAWGLAAVAALPYFLFAAGTGGHAMQTQVMQLMHSGINEFQTLAGAAALGKMPLWAAAYSSYGLTPLYLLAAFAVALWPGRPAAWRLALLASAAMAAAFAGLAAWQVRWTSMAQTLAMVPCFLLLCAARRAPAAGRRPLALLVSVPLLVYALFSGSELLRLTRNAAEASRVDGYLLSGTLFDRIQAIRLRAAMEEAEGEGAAEKARLLLPISSGPAFAWHGGFRLLGALYWENVFGVADQYRILLDEEEGAPRAEEIVRRRGITHILATDPDKPLPPEVAEKPTLEIRLLSGKDLPGWLERDEKLTKALDVQYVLDVPPLDDVRAAKRQLEGKRRLVAYRVKAGPEAGEAAGE